MSKAGQMAPKNPWAFSLIWINLAVGVVALVQIAAHQISTVPDLLHVLAYELAYANLTGALGVLVIGGIARRLAGRKFSMVRLFAVGVVVLTAVGCLIAQTLFMAAGFIARQNFWNEYFQKLRIAMPLAVVFGFGALAYGTLRERAQWMEKELQDREVAEERTRKLAAEARLRSLESRIHPHFLFNTLNSISSLIVVNPSRAEQIVGRLAALLRASLDTSRQPLIPLREELAMVESYLDIERVRFGDKLRSSIEVPVALQNFQVPPMSVQSLVENAVKHGITPQTGGGELVVAAASENGSLRIEVRDSGPGFDLSVVRAGHGLDSLVERLDALFGTKARLNVVRREGYSVVEMIVPVS
jgi:sensor histidine kinase YesM